MPFLKSSNMASTSKPTLFTRPNHLLAPRPQHLPLAPPHPQRALSTHSLSRTLRLSPKTRTRLQNVAFLTATLVSIITVSLAMSGSAGVGLPCPARQGTRVGMQDENGKDWATTGTKGKRRWLEEPVVVAQSGAPRGKEGQDRTGPRTGLQQEESRN
ncbi:BZ3500_MvSof-1268-A1-R1_Chr1-3g01867 [Microbotryum saponariae]|uniref:BZ3500_MvSof-1268-A1-R1_Chr1-3g01867 protein n=1 Tax=Microbotryum saponariae TaxID=289078 RepID=A0A2X0KD08_9BASI|nr:BZ3500_MvSof-1268-A1-R1_Chr1-3g01867 [Microbotryum saponariae]SCZ94770.1 BZ3501_MvSof-1269-A2-R1_Chr1-3g01469 [Microbotryum saponariae]